MLELEERLGYSFRNPKLLEMALSHSSYANEILRDDLKSYERLEFLGDSILGFVTADYLYRKLPNILEGNLTRLRADLVCESSLAATAQTLKLGECLKLGHGEETSGGRGRASINSDVVESIIAAIYLDGGFEAAKQFIYRSVLVDTAQRIEMNTDYKTQLQELVQQKKEQSLTYRLAAQSGPDHDKLFTVEVLLNDTVIGSGSGSSKKRAEQEAAHRAMMQLFPEE